MRARLAAASSAGGSAGAGSGSGASAGAGDDAVMMIERTLADEAKRRAKAGGTMRSAMELRSDGSVRGDGKRAVFLKVDESGSSLRWGEVQGAGNPARMNRGAAFANVGRVERRGDGLVVRLVRRDGDVFEFTGKSVEEAAMWLQTGLAAGHRVASLHLAHLAYDDAGREDVALAHLKNFLSWRVARGRDWCAGCDQKRGGDAPMLTCSGCRVARFCSADHQKMASKSVASGGDFIHGRHKDICGLLGKWRGVGKDGVSADSLRGDLLAFLRQRA